MNPIPMVVTVLVAGLWTDPSAPRPVDRDLVVDEPDVAGWLAALDGSDGSAAPVPAAPDAGRLGLHDRLDTQLLGGEPVLVVEAGRSDGWARVVCPSQPSSRDARGYPGWVRAAHLGPVEPVVSVALVEPVASIGPVAPLASIGPVAPLASTAPAHRDPADPGPGPCPAGTASGATFLAAARAYAGTGYLWGGLTAYGIDCSGLVHIALREVGIRVPRDAHDQQSAVTRVTLDAARPGDLFFFARPGRVTHHVGIATAPGVMLHAPQVGAVVVEERLSSERLATLVGVGRVPGIR